MKQHGTYAASCVRCVLCTQILRFVLLVQLVGPDCRILLSKYIEILAFIRRGIVAAGHSAEEAEAFVERHGRVLKELAVVSRITRRVEGTGPGGLLSVQVKTELKAACAAFGSAWTTTYPNRAMTPNGPRYRGARPRLCGYVRHLWGLWRGRRRGAPRHGLGGPEVAWCGRCATPRPATRHTPFTTLRALLPHCSTERSKAGQSGRGPRAM